jgi:hypothetical protein
MGAKYGVDYAVVRVHVSLETPFLAREAAEKAGFKTMSDWFRDRLTTLFAEELGEDKAALMAAMPLTWEQNPGVVARSQPSKSSE